MLMELLRKPGTEVIWSNVLIDANGVPHWVGNGEEPRAKKGKNFQGDWVQGMKDANGKEIPWSHPNSRCTLSAKSAQQLFRSFREESEGAETRFVITYSGRDSDQDAAGMGGQEFG